jgi:hypothetical protein
MSGSCWLPELLLEQRKTPLRLKTQVWMLNWQHMCAEEAGDYSWLLCFRMYSVSSSITWHHFNQGQIQRTNTKQCLITEPVISSTSTSKWPWHLLAMTAILVCHSLPINCVTFRFCEYKPTFHFIIITYLTTFSGN